MYKKLKFSWAHILAFLALIFISYVSFVGLTYMIDDGFIKPALGVLGILIVLLIWFVGVQQLRGVDNNFSFSKCVWWERFFIFTSPLILIVCLIPFNHAWNVASHSKQIENTFRNAIQSSTKMFEDYDVYSQNRIADYQDFLNRVKNNRSIQPSIYDKIGFTGTHDDKKVQLEVQTLERQLTANYSSLQTEARQWINRVDQTTSVWNVFLVGNIKEIMRSIIDWRTQMGNFSKVILTTERNGGYAKIEPFDANEEGVRATINQLDSLSNIYTHSEGVSMTAVILGIILYFLLLFPYILQERNGVSTYTLLGRRFVGKGITLHDSPKRRRGESDFEPFNLDEDKGITNVAKKENTRSKNYNSNIDGMDIVGGYEDDEDYREVSREQRIKERQRRRNSRKRETDSDQQQEQRGQYANQRNQYIINDDDNDFSPINDI